MGAQRFQETGVGNSAEEAFRLVREEALYQHGHRGYTGTIAEKDAFVLVRLPDGYSATEFEKEVWSLYYEEDCEEMEAKGAPDKKLVCEAARIAQDKWGPAVCVELTNEEAKHHLGKASGKVYRFFGLASS